jgi:signal transduction histidine kinase/ActR/RegA family two-component response regulator
MSTVAERRFDRRAWVIFAGILTSYLVMTGLRRIFVLPEALAPIWPATALMAAGLLLLDGKRRLLLLGCAGLAFLVLILTINPASSIRALIGVPESILLAYLTHRWVGRSLDFCDGRRIALYVAGAALPSSLIASVALFCLSQWFGKPASLLNAYQFGSAHFLGAALTLPSVVVLTKARKYRPYTHSMRGAIAASGLLIAYTCVVLWGPPQQLSVLVAFPAALWIAIRYGPVGAAVLAFYLIGLSIGHAYLTNSGLIHPAFQGPWVQQFATLLFMTTLPTAGMVTVLRRIRNVLKRRTETARRARHRADLAVRSKTEFLANMSHEIRTPLNGVLGLADAVSRTPLRNDQRKMIEMICASGQTLNRLLSDSLDVARAEAGVLTLEAAPFDLSDTIGAATYVFETLARDKAVGFKVECRDRVARAPVGDPLRIRQIVSNLTGNAVKFTDAGLVKVTAELAPAGADRARLTVTVQDTGPGFDSGEKERLFSRFEQADPTIARSHGGSGLGLAISQTLAGMMGGRIDCHSAPGEGAVFTFQVELPLAEAPVQTGSESGGGAVEADRPLQVLLAEDHPVNQEVIRALLGEYAELTVVENGQEAIEAFKTRGFDLVLMDTQMPVMDGVTATRAIRALERERGAPRRPIISLTASAMPQQVMAAIEAGADLHLAKPVSGASLFAAITQVLAAAEAQGEGPAAAA